MTNPIYTLPYQETPLDRDTRDRVVRIEALLESLKKSFYDFVKESQNYRKEMAEEGREFRNEILKIIEEINDKHEKYDAIINKESGKWAIIIPLSAIIGSLACWLMEYFVVHWWK